MPAFAYVDTSALLAILLAEPAAEEMHARLQGFDRLLSSNLLEAEMRAAGAREDIPTPSIEAILAPITWVFPNRALRAEMNRTLTIGYLRGADLWHVSCALFLARQLPSLTFVSLDRRQCEVAANVQLPMV